MDTQTLNLIRSANPWLVDRARFPKDALFRIPPTFIRREGIDLTTRPGRLKAHLIVGARQVGKSTALWHHFIESNTPPLFINAEESRFQSWCRSPTLMLEDLKNIVPPDMPVLIDEAQQLEDAGLLVKGLIDGGLENPLFVTGSSSFHLRDKIRESLAGRVRRYHLHPLTLKEIGNSLGNMPPLLLKDEIHRATERQMQWGSYPESWTSEDPQSVTIQLAEAFVLRDASDLFRVENLDAFRKLLSLIAAQVGNLVNIAEWASLCGVARTTIERYLVILKETHIAQVVPPFVAGKRAEITSTPKIYFCDLGIRNAVNGHFERLDDRIDKGAVFESWVAGELMKLIDPLAPHESPRFWRTKSGAEVDFVAEHQGELFAFEAKASQLKRNVLSRSQRSFIEAYKPKKLFIINRTLEAEERIDNTRVIWTTPVIFLNPSELWS